MRQFASDDKEAISKRKLWSQDENGNLRIDLGKDASEWPIILGLPIRKPFL